MLYRLCYCCIWWTPPPGVVTHLSAKQAKDGHRHLPAGVLPLICCTCSAWGRIWGSREETLFLVCLPYFNPSGMDSGEWGTLCFSGVGGSFFSTALAHSAGASESTKAALQRCPAPPQLHAVTTQQMNELETAHRKQPAPLRSLWSKQAITSSQPLVLTPVNSSFMMPTH